jgi:two-component system, cell cycle sensor histidine kinase and response regulator CckA
MNLVTNAAESIERGRGTITLATGVTPIGDGQLWSAHLRAHLPAGQYVFLEVADTGCGMAADLIAKIFDPFFTTKFVGRGLGLAAVQGIAHGHGGVLQVRSELGKGSEFRLLLPCSTKVVAPAVSPVAAAVEVWRGSGTILVIDDEKAVRDVTSRFLVLSGFTVLVAPDGADGLAVFRQHQETIDALIVDLTMPGLGGLEVAEAVRSLRPDLPIVLMTGFNVHDAPLQYEGYGITGFVKKPFNRAELITAVRRALKP